MGEKLDITMHPNKTYMYVLEGAEKVRMMTIDIKDVVKTTDGFMECPLDLILSKNKVTTDDLKKWRIESIRLVEIAVNSEKVLCEIDSSRIPDLLQA